jgi:hypothetical protein
VDKGMLVVEWGQFQFLDLNHKPPKNKFLLFNKKNLINKITQQNVDITNKTNFFSGITKKASFFLIPHLPSNDERCEYN